MLIKTISRIFIIILIVLFIIASVLFYGVKVDSFSNKYVNISKLYVKLNKKLVVNVDKLEITLSKQNKTNNSKDSLLNIGNYLKALKIIFSEIKIDKFVFNGDISSFHYNKESFYLDNKFLKIDMSLHSEDNNITAIVKEITLKDFNTTITGTLSNNLKTHKSKLSTKFKIFDISGELNAYRDNNMIEYEAKTDEFDGLDSIYELLKKLRIGSATLKMWLVDNIKSKQIKIESFKGKLDFKKQNFYFDEMKATGYAKNTRIYFVKDRTIYAKSKNIKLKLRKGTLYLFPYKLETSKGVAAHNTKAQIYNIFSKKIGLLLKLRANAMLSNHINKILKNFGIRLPLLQLDGNSEVALDMKMNFLPFTFDINGVILIQTAHFKLSNSIDFYTPSAKLVFKDSIINFEEMKIENQFLNFVADIKYNLKKKKMTGVLNSINSNIEVSNNSLFEISGATSPISLDLKNAVELEVQKFSLKAKFKENFFSLYIPSYKVYPYSKVLQKYDLEDTILNITSYNYQHFIFDIRNIKQSIIPNVKDVKIKANFNKHFTKLEILDEKIEIDIKDEKIELNLKDVTFNLTKLDLPNSGNSKPKPLELIAKNTSLLYKSIKLLNYNATLLKDKYLTLNAKKQNHNIFYETNRNGLKFVSNIGTSKELNTILGQDIFIGGSFSLKGYGLDENNISIEFSSSKTTLKGMVFFNNLMAFINTIPSILTMKNPDFSTKGYKLKSINAKMRYINGILYFDTINLNGNSSDILGKGEINLKTNQIKLLLQVSFLDGLSRILKNIPLAGHIILGKDKKMSIGVKVKGSLDKPIISTQTTKDILTLPFRVFRRIFEAPFN